MTETIYGVLATAYRPDACPECGKVKILWDSRGTCLNKWHDSVPPAAGATPSKDLHSFENRLNYVRKLVRLRCEQETPNATIRDMLAHIDELRAENERLRKELDEARK